MVFIKEEIKSKESEKINKSKTKEGTRESLNYCNNKNIFLGPLVKLKQDKAFLAKEPADRNIAVNQFLTHISNINLALKGLELFWNKLQTAKNLPNPISSTVLQSRIVQKSAAKASVVQALKEVHNHSPHSISKELKHDIHSKFLFLSKTKQTNPKNFASICYLKDLRVKKFEFIDKTNKENKYLMQFIDGKVYFEKFVFKALAKAFNFRSLLQVSKNFNKIYFGNYFLSAIFLK